MSYGNVAFAVLWPYRRAILNHSLTALIALFFLPHGVPLGDTAGRTRILEHQLVRNTRYLSPNRRRLIP